MRYSITSNNINFMCQSMTQTEPLASAIVNALDDLKAIDIQILDVREMTSFTDTMIIASGRSDRQVKALADGVIDAAREHGIKPVGVEGLPTEWILVDLGDAVAHLMHPTARAYYQLEKLWSNEIKMSQPSVQQ